MKRLLFLIILLLILTATPAWASKPSEKKNAPSVVTEQNEETTEIEGEDCGVDADWKNHGQYVSCVARQKLGGKTVSEAARSNIGKSRPTPTSTPSALPSPSASPSALPSATPSSAPVSSGSASLADIKLQAVNNEIKALITASPKPRTFSAGMKAKKGYSLPWHVKAKRM